MTKRNAAVRALEKQASKRPTKLRLKTAPYLPGLYSHLRDPEYAANYIVEAAKAGDEAVLRLAVSDLIAGLRSKTVSQRKAKPGNTRNG
jgi:hypothetical protein